jgi:hypothetical protein
MQALGLLWFIPSVVLCAVLVYYQEVISLWGQVVLGFVAIIFAEISIYYIYFKKGGKSNGT